MGETDYYNVSTISSATITSLNSGSNTAMSGLSANTSNKLGNAAANSGSTTYTYTNTNPTWTTASGNVYSSSAYSTWMPTDNIVDLGDPIGKAVKDKIKEVISTEDDMMPIIKRYLRDYLEEILDNPNIVFSNEEELDKTKKELEETKKELKETKKDLEEAKGMLYQAMSDIYELRKKVSELETKANTPGDYWTSTSSPYIQWATSTTDPIPGTYVTLGSVLGTELSQTEAAIGISQDSTGKSNHPPEIS